MKHKLKEMDIKGVRVSSCGLYASEGSKISKNSFEALKRFDIRFYGFKSKKITYKILRQSDYVICMTEGHKKLLEGYDNVYTVSELGEVPEIGDPYGKDLSAYLNVAFALDTACDRIIEKLRLGE